MAALDICSPRVYAQVVSYKEETMVGFLAALLLIYGIKLVRNAEL